MGNYRLVCPPGQKTTVWDWRSPYGSLGQSVDLTPRTLQARQHSKSDPHPHRSHRTVRAPRSLYGLLTSRVHRTSQLSILMRASALSSVQYPPAIRLQPKRRLLHQRRRCILRSERVIVISDVFGIHENYVKVASAAKSFTEEPA